MALIQSAFIWVVYAVVLVLVIAIASIFVYLYQTPRDRAASVTIVCIFTLTSLLATVLLLPVDVALVSSTTSSKLGRRKDWATGDRIDSIVLTLKIVYYTLYSLDALLCLIVVPFTYFWYEEYDEVATEEGNQTLGSRFWGALKYTLAFIALVIIIFLVGFFVPVAKNHKGGHFDLEFFKHILGENRKLMFQHRHPVLTSYSNRWRTRFNLWARPTHHDWHTSLCSVHSRGVSFATGRFDQVSSSNLCAKLQCQHSFSFGTKS